MDQKMLEKLVLENSVAVAGTAMSNAEVMIDYGGAVEILEEAGEKTAHALRLLAEVRDILDPKRR